MTMKVASRTTLLLLSLFYSLISVISAMTSYEIVGQSQSQSQSEKQENCRNTCIHDLCFPIDNPPIDYGNNEDLHIFVETHSTSPSFDHAVKILQARINEFCSFSSSLDDNDNDNDNDNDIDYEKLLSELFEKEIDDVNKEIDAHDYEFYVIMKKVDNNNNDNNNNNSNDLNNNISIQRLRRRRQLFHSVISAVTPAKIADSSLSNKKTLKSKQTIFGPSKLKPRNSLSSVVALSKPAEQALTAESENQLQLEFDGKHYYHSVLQEADPLNFTPPYIDADHEEFNSPPIVSDSSKDTTSSSSSSSSSESNENVEILEDVKKDGRINYSIRLDEKKVVDNIELSSSTEGGDKVVLCRCWKSEKFPLCDGCHVKHNKETGDNVGPAIVSIQ